MGVKSIEPKQRGFVRILRQVDATEANHGLSVEGKKVMKEQVPTKVSKHVKCKNGREEVGGGEEKQNKQTSVNPDSFTIGRATWAKLGVGALPPI